jgi:transketolase
MSSQDPLETMQESTRLGFGRGLLAAAEDNLKVVALCADLTESTRMDLFKEAFPERFIEVGVAEQNLVTVASGMAATGWTPFVSSYAAFCPGRCWEQIRTTICINNQNVKIIGSHAGLSVGPDGATHQALEDIALMRVLSNMQVFAPADSIEAEKITKAIAQTNSPSYLRLARADTPVFTNPSAPFVIGKAVKLHSGDDITILSTGTISWQALQAAQQLRLEGINAEVLHLPTIKPLDEEAILEAAKRTKRFITIEEHQRSGGLGSAIAELVSGRFPIPVVRIGIDDKFGQSGTPEELLRTYGLTSTNIVRTTLSLIKR